MRHLDQERLAGLALEEPGRTSLRERAHLRLCDQCAADLAELRQIVTTGRSAQPVELRAPSPALLGQIQAELAGDAGSYFDSPASPRASTPASPTGVRGTRTRPQRAARPVRRYLTAAVAAVAIAAVGVGGILWYGQRSASDDVVLARATLNPLPDKSGQGTAELKRRDGVQVLSVDIRADTVGTGFEELWLINTDGKRMISLGVLPPDGRGTYPVPASASGELEGYTIVDVSLEPFDGKAAHSLDSLVRGTLS